MARWIRARTPQTGVSPLALQMARGSRQKSDKNQILNEILDVLYTSQWALIATWNQSQVRMPKQAARFSVPVFLGTGLARSPNAFVTFKYFSFPFEVTTYVIEKHVCGEKKNPSEDFYWIL